MWSEKMLNYGRAIHKEMQKAYENGEFIDYFSEKWDNGGLINLEKIESARLGENGIEGWNYSGCEVKFMTGPATIVFNTRQNLIELYDASDNANVTMDQEISEAIDDYFGFFEW